MPQWIPMYKEIFTCCDDGTLQVEKKYVGHLYGELSNFAPEPQWPEPGEDVSNFSPEPHQYERGE